MASQPKYNVKIFDQDGTTFIRNISPAVDRRGFPTFTSKMNGGFSPVVLDFVDTFKFDDFDEGNTVDFMNIVEIEAVDENNTLGRTIFKGFISRYEPYIRNNGDEGVLVNVLHLSNLLSASFYKNGSNYTVSHSGDDPETIVRAIIDHFNTIFGGSLLSYTDDTTDPVGTNVSIDFVDKKWFNALQETGKLAGTDWWWKIDATGVLSFLPKPSTATHTFTVSKDILTINATKDMEKVVNDAQVRRTGGSPDFSDGTSQVTFGTGSPATGKWSKIINESQLNDADAASQRGNKVINDNKDEKIKATITIGREYDLESIKVGETCKIRNFAKDNSFFNDNMQIVSLAYRGDVVVLSLGQEPVNFARELDQLINPS